MGAIWFASDLHLTALEDPVFERFSEFCERVGEAGGTLYLLGDLFEAWVGDDEDGELAEAVAGVLRALAARGVDLAFAHGNRDFLLGPGYAQRCGMRLLAEVEVIGLAGRKVALLHGDTLCSDDVEYQTVRRQLRDPAWQRQFLGQPLGARRRFAAQARARSAAHTAMAAAEIMDVNAAAVEALYGALGVEWIIHGHTHRPGVHEFAAGRRRIVLGDWGRHASWLRVEGELATLYFEGRELRVA